jgi:hypothetical protein
MSQDSKLRDDATTGDRPAVLQKERQMESEALKPFIKILH